MKIKVILEREYEVNCSLEDMNFDSIDDICGMEELDVIEEESKVTTTWLVEGSVEIVEE